MIEVHLLILIAALVADWFLGEPEWLWGRIGHPVAWFGRLIGALDSALNHESDRPAVRTRNGAVAWVMAVAAALVAARALGIHSWGAKCVAAAPVATAAGELSGVHAAAGWRTADCRGRYGCI